MLFQPLFRGKLVRLTAPIPADSEEFAFWTQNDEYLRLLDDDPIRPLGPAHYNFGTSDSANTAYFHLRTLSEDRLIGFVVLFNIKWASQTAELAIGIGEPGFVGKGYGSDALRIILNYGFYELNLYRIGLSVMDYNIRAIRSYEQAGFVREGARRQAVQREGKRYDLLLYGILRDEWLQQTNG